MRRDANSFCSHKKVARGKLVPPMKLPLPTESESDMINIVIKKTLKELPLPLSLI